MSDAATSTELEQTHDQNAPQMIAPTAEGIAAAYNAIENAEVPPEVGDPQVTARAIRDRIRAGSLADSMSPAESLPSWGDTLAGEKVIVYSFHLNRSAFEIAEGPNKGKKGVYAVVELGTPDGELITVQTGSQNVLTQLVKAWEERRFPFPAVIDVKATGQPGRTVQWLVDPAAYEAQQAKGKR